MSVDVLGRMEECRICGSWGTDVRHRRQNTAYADHDQNFATLCDCCQEEADDHWASMWAELHADLWRGIMDHA